jgi:hypothetical protein
MKEKALIYLVSFLITLATVGGYMLFAKLDTQIKEQAKEIERQQLVISLQQVEIDSYRIKSQESKEAEKLVKDLL